MSAQGRYLEVLSKISASLPLGAASISVLLGSAAPSESSPMAFVRSQGVADHLAAVREAVSGNLVLAANRPSPRRPPGWRNFWGNW